MSLVRQTLDKEKYEVLIINNNSSDKTQVVAEEFALRNKNFRVLKQDKQGLSHARNLGWRESKGDIIIFLDDDAVACKNWVETYMHIFAKHDPGCAGGKIEIEWESKRPKWLSDGMLKFLGYLDLSDAPEFLTKPSLYGGNFAIRKATLQDLDGFNTELGRGKSDLAGNEEIELQKRIITIGKSIYYSPSSIIYHYAPLSRMKFYWFLKRSFWQGVSDAKIFKIENSVSAKKIFSVLYNVFFLCIRITINILKINREGLILNLIDFSRELGFLLTINKYIFQ